MAPIKSLLTTFALASSAVCDFTFGSISGLQVSGDYEHPDQQALNGHWILGVDGESYSQSDFCDGGIGLTGNDNDGNPLDDAWTKVVSNPDEPPNYCDKPIPGLDTRYVIRQTGTGANGDCGGASVTGDYYPGKSVGSIVDKIYAPYGEAASCYYDYNCKYCANTGSQYARAIFTCVGGVGGSYNSGIKGVSSDELDSDC